MEALSNVNVNINFGTQVFIFPLPPADPFHQMMNPLTQTPIEEQKHFFLKNPEAFNQALKWYLGQLNASPQYRQYQFDQLCKKVTKEAPCGCFKAHHVALYYAVKLKANPNFKLVSCKNKDRCVFASKVSCDFHHSGDLKIPAELRGYQSQKPPSPKESPSPAPAPRDPIEQSIPLMDQTPSPRNFAARAPADSFPVLPGLEQMKQRVSLWRGTHTLMPDRPAVGGPVFRCQF